MVVKKVKIKGAYMLHERLVNETNLALFTGDCNGRVYLFNPNFFFKIHSKQKIQ